MTDAPAGYGEEALLPISGIQHFSFCRRQWALIHLEGQWAENLDTAVGSTFHGRAHGGEGGTVRGVRTVRSVTLVSRTLGLKGIADVVEFDYGEDGGCDGIPKRVVPVEYKKGRSKVSDCDRLQLCAQALCLEEMLGIPVSEGCLFYGQTRRREAVSIDEGLRTRLEDVVSEMRDLWGREETPLPVRRGACRRCSLNDACVPALADRSAAGYWAE